MPFTFAHPAIILPLARINSRFISLTALIIGSITPDFECFVRMKAKSVYSHTLWGILYFDLPLAIFIFLVWGTLIKRIFINNLPVFLQRKFANKEIVNLNWTAVFFSLFIGIISHLLWDSFTHTDGYFVQAIPVLRKPYYFMWDSMLYSWLRNISGVLGAILVLLVIVKLPAAYNTYKGDKWYWPIVLAFTVATFTVRCLLPHRILSLGDYFSTLVAGLFIGIIVASIIHKAKIQ